jgi:hypothetical protein
MQPGYCALCVHAVATSRALAPRRRRNVTGKTIADRAKNTEGYITIPALHTSKITPVSSALHGEILLTKAQEFARLPDTVSKFYERTISESLFFGEFALGVTATFAPALPGAGQKSLYRPTGKTVHPKS